MYTPGSIVIFLGPPGCGKGTQAARLSSDLQIPSISTGEILRQACRSGTELGNKVRTVLEAGQLVSDELMNQVVSQRLLADDCRDGCILDGYPRTVPQAQFLSGWLQSHRMQPPLVVDFSLDDSEIVNRLSRRRLCGQCARIYGAHPQTGAPQVFCEADGSVLLQRPDDRPDVIRARLRIYNANAEKLIRFFEGENYLRLSAAGSPDEVTAELMLLLGLQTPPQAVPRLTPLTSRAAYSV